MPGEKHIFDSWHEFVAPSSNGDSCDHDTQAGKKWVPTRFTCVNIREESHITFRLVF